MSNKIDAMVAEKVMGWYGCTEGCSKCGDPTRCFFVDSDGSVWKHGGIVPFSPSTSISAAWEVVRRVRDFHGEPFGGMGDMSIKFNPYAGLWTVVFNWSNNMPVEGDSPSECTAICIAALKAVGVPESEIQEAMQ